MKKQERLVIESRYALVRKELLECVEEVTEYMSFNRVVQLEFAMHNTQRERTEREFWEMGGEKTKWRCVEKGCPGDVFFHCMDGGMRCKDASTMQLAVC